MEQNKPKYLYRGIVLAYDKLSDFNITDDLVVVYDPIIDKNGIKVFLDGNEYGVYMSDNPTMVSNVYGNIHGHGTAIRYDITIDSDKKRISIPSVGISYKIDTQGIAVRRPQISSVLLGHYNNGFEGDEWIADKIPSSNYQVSRIRIGSDVLHDAEDVSIIDGDVEQAKIQAIQDIQMRKFRLESLIDELSKMTPYERNFIGKTQLNVLKSIFGSDGVKYVNANDIDTSTNVGKIKQLMFTFYNQGNGKINFTTLGYIEGLKFKLSKSQNPNSAETLEQIIVKDIKENENNKTDFIQRKSEEGVEFSTGGFDKRTELMTEMLSNISTINGKKDKDSDEKEIGINPNYPNVPNHTPIEHETEGM